MTAIEKVQPKISNHNFKFNELITKKMYLKYV